MNRITIDGMINMPLWTIQHVRCCLIGLMLLWGCSCGKNIEKPEFTFKLLDNYVTLAVPETSRDEFTKIITLCRERMEEAAVLFDPENADSEIARINRLSEGVRFPISFETARILRFANTYYEQSEGAFDVSIFPLSYMWGFHGGVPPGDVSDVVVAASVNSVGLDKIGIYENTIELRSPFSRIDLGGLIEGYLVDLAILKLRSNNYNDLYVQFGNSIRTLGMEDEDTPWTLQIPHPYEANTPIGILTFKNKMAASYSYIYGDTIDNEGMKITHIFDPRTGKPCSDTVYSLALGPTAHMTDALSTTLVVQGLEGANNMLRNFDARCEGLLIPNQKPLQIFVSENMLEYFTPTPEFADAVQPIPEKFSQPVASLDPELRKIIHDEEDATVKHAPMPKTLRDILIGDTTSEREETPEDGE